MAGTTVCQGSAECHMYAPVKSSGDSHEVQTAGGEVNLLCTARLEGDVWLGLALLQLLPIGIHSPDLQPIAKILTCSPPWVLLLILSVCLL